MVFFMDAGDFNRFCNTILMYLSKENKGKWIIESHGSFTNYLKYQPSPDKNQIQIDIFCRNEELTIIVGELNYTRHGINPGFETHRMKEFKLSSYESNEILKQGLASNVAKFLDPYVKKISKEILLEFYKKAA